ncbi:MAG: hypothetical protein JOY96_08315 [Verrucomicrobia bacterium]|nr:hypothetical protein [Verrucomicrobiota bacterium]MBV9672081.1 hypothetical protein [Verrucomicrobiota bacterium]
MTEKELDRLFAEMRRVPEENPVLPAGFAETVIRKHRIRARENQVFTRAAVFSVAGALGVLGTIYGFVSLESDRSNDQDLNTDVAYALWDPAGN